MFTRNLFNYESTLSICSSTAKIASNVVIEPFVNIEKNVTVEEGTWIGSNVTIMEGAHIGKNCRIFPGAVISAIPQDLKYRGEETKVRIGNNTTIREFVTINRGTQANNETIVGNNCLIMAYAHIAHDCTIGNHVILANCATWPVILKLRLGYSNGGSCSAVRKIGSHTYVSGGSLVRKDVPPYVKAAREPLSYVGVNSIGLRRRGYSNEQINAIQDIYRMIYLKNYNVSQAVAIIEADFPVTKDRDAILSFISKSTRGIMKGYQKYQKNDI